MKLGGKTIRRGLGAATLAALLIALAAPWWNLDRYARRIQAGLEKELHRRVSIGQARLEVLRGPGFSLGNVVIYEDPRVGREPLAYVTALEARVALSSLWTGRLEFASLTLVEPSVNLTKPAEGAWNFEDLLERSLAGAAPGVALPRILVRSGRINFKLGDVKSVFYVTNADLDLNPPRNPGGPWSVRFSGEPARTDRPAQGLGRIAGRGRWTPGGRLELALELERSYLEEISALLAGRDLGLRGQVTSRALLGGPVSDLEIAGRAQLRGFRRWDLMPAWGADLEFDYRGRLDLPGQRLTLEASPLKDSPLRVRLRMFDYLSQPRWGVLAAFQDWPLEAAGEWLRVAGASLPEGVQLKGVLSGGAGYSPASGLRGAMLLSAARLAAPGWEALACARLPLRLDRGELRFGPGALERADKTSLILEGAWAWERSGLSLKLADKGSPVAARGGGVLPGLEPVPVLNACRGGAWGGALRYERRAGKAGRWNGRIQVRGAEMALPGLASALRLEEAEIRLTPEGAAIVGLRGRVGEAGLEGDYRYEASGARPHRFRLSVGELEAGELERLLAPTLDRRRGLLARALRLGRAPDWLRDRRLEGEFQVASLRWNGAPVAGPVRGRLKWDGLRVEIAGLEARLPEGGLTGRLAADLRAGAPAYRLTGALGPWASSGGRWSAEGFLETSGLGEDLLENLRAEGWVLGRSVEFAPGQEFDWLAARFSLHFAGRVPRLKIERLEAVHSGEIFRGEGRALPDGRLMVELAGARRQLRLLATLWPPRLEPAAH
jgi:hypothetical protein